MSETCHPNQPVTKYTLGQSLRFFVTSGESNNTIVEGKVVGYDCQDRLLCNYALNGVQYNNASIHINRILPTKL